MIAENERDDRTKYCFICGSQNESGLQLKFYWDESNRSYAEFVIPDHLVGYKGIFHGGIITAVLDDVMYYAMMREIPNVMTVNININFRSPAYVGRKVRAVGEVIEKRGKVISARGFLLDEETVLAEAEGKFVIVPEEKTMI